jgi:hypothetical protein
MRKRAIALLLAAWPCATGCMVSQPPDDLFNVRLGMLKDDVDGMLGRKHALALDKAGPGGAEQVWELQDPSFQSLAIAYDPDLRVKYVTAHGRTGGKPVRYRDLGKLEYATLTGKYFYTWTVRGESDAAAYAVVARGTDPQYLFSVSLYLPLVGAPPEPGQAPGEP